MTRQELQAELTKLGERAGVKVNLDQSNAGLAKAVEELTARVASTAQANQATGDMVAAERDRGPDLLRAGRGMAVARGRDEANVGGPLRFAYQVAAGVTIQCKRGKLQRGMEVRPSDVGGEAELEKKVAAGHVLRGPLSAAARRLG